MKITIDIGNSYTKMAIWENNTIVHIHKVADINSVWGILNQYQKAIILWCSVKPIPNFMLERINANKETHQHIIFSAETAIPIKNNYETPATLGLDRLAAAIGAAIHYPRKDVLIIDIGTCITYDLVAAQNGYMGGSISPGFQLRYQSLHNYTAKLPLLSLVAKTNLVGSNTTQAIQGGVVNGLLAEVKQMILQYQATYPQLQTILCGGDAVFVAQHLEFKNIYLEKNLVHLGLYAVLEHLSL